MTPQKKLSVCKQCKRVKEIRLDKDGYIHYTGTVDNIVKQIISLAQNSEKKKFMEMIEDLRIKSNTNVYDKLSQEQISWNLVLDKLLTKLNSEGKE